MVLTEDLTKLIDEIVKECRGDQIKPEEDEMYDFVKKQLELWLGKDFDGEAATDEELTKEISSQLQYYIYKYKEERGQVKSSPTWKALEEAYLVSKGKLKPEQCKSAAEWSGTNSDAIMFYALEAFAKKRVGSLTKKFEEILKKIGTNDYFRDDVVASAIEATGIFKPEKSEDKKTIFDKVRNEYEFCRYFNNICRNKYIDAVKAKVKEKCESYDAMSAKGFEVGAGIDGNILEKGRLPWELQALLKLVLRQVAEGPLEDYSDAPGVHRNLGGAFAKYVPFLKEEFIERGGRYELLTVEADTVPKGEIVIPGIRKGAKQAAEQMYPIVENHDARSAALLFSDIIRNQLGTASYRYDWSGDFYRRIAAYEKDAGRKKYRDVISSVKTMENHAKKLHEKAISMTAEVLEKRLSKLDSNELSEEKLLMEQLKKLT